MDIWEHGFSNFAHNLFPSVDFKRINFVFGISPQRNKQVKPQLTFESMKFIPPELEQVKSKAKEIGLPEHEALKFHAYYEANGWMVGRTKMRQWVSALSGWKLRWEERQPNKTLPEQNGKTVLTKAQEIFYSKELQQIQRKLEELNYEGRQYGWSKKLCAERYQFIRRLNELKKLLNLNL